MYMKSPQKNTIGQSIADNIKGVVCRSSLAAAAPERQKRKHHGVRRPIAAPASSTDLGMLKAIFRNLSQCSNSKSVPEALLKKFRSFGRVITASDSELRTVHGLGQSEITALKLVAASVEYMLKKAIIKGPMIHDSIDLGRYLKARLQHERVEVFLVLYFNSRNRLIEDEEICRGTLDQVPFYPREVIRRCLELDAKSIVMAHNHPSGHVQPSREDEMSTREIDEATKLFNIVLRDHIVVGNGEMFSFRSNDLI